MALRKPVFENAELPVKTRVNIYDSTVRSLALYSLDAFNLTRGDINDVQKFQDQCLRKIAERSELQAAFASRMGDVEDAEHQRLPKTEIESASGVASVASWHASAQLRLISRGLCNSQR